MRRDPRVGFAPVCLLLSLFLFAFAHPADARSVTLAWDENPPEEGVAGYVIHYGTASRAAADFKAYEGRVDVGKTTAAAITLPDEDATYYLAVVAYNEYGLSSDYSAEVVASPGADGEGSAGSGDGGGGGGGSCFLSAASPGAASMVWVLAVWVEGALSRLLSKARACR